MKKIDNVIRIKDNKEKEYAIFLLSFLLPLIMMVAILISKHVFPFGDRCILRTDFYHQYLPFHAELQNKLKNFESLFYTYKVGLGTNFITLFAYYLSCPFNILLFFVSEDFTLEFITVMVVLKIALAGLTMSYYLVKRYDSNSFVIVFFAIFYAMSGYVGAYYWNIMWLDNILLFPLLMLGFENVQNNKKPYLYIITLALSILCNYYIGTITCFFFVIYFVFYNILKEKKLKEIGINLLKTFIYSLIGVLISSILLAPILYAFKTTASSDSTFPSTFKEYFTMAEVIGRHLPFVTIENGIEYWPNLYSGIACFPLIVMYFLSKKYKTREKICYAVLLLFFIASFSINVLDYIWHVFKYPNSLPCRQSFIYTFLILTIAIKPLFKINSIKVKDISVCFAIAICFLILVEKAIKNEKIGFYSVYAALILLFIYLIIFIKHKSKKVDKNILLYATVVVVCLEAFMNMYQTSITTIKREDYMKNVKSIRNMVSGIKDMTDDFYRVERVDLKTKDDGAFMHFPSSSIFSSSAYVDGSNFYKAFGMEASTNAYSVTGSTPFADALLDVKYKIYEKEEKNASNLNMRLIASDADSEVYLYQNIDVLPLSFILKDDFLEKYDKSSGNPATVQNNFSRALNLGTVLNKKTVEITGTTAKIKIDEPGDYYAFVRDKGIKEVIVDYPTTSKSFKNLNRGFFIELGYLDSDVELGFRNDTNDDELLIEVFRSNFDTLKKVVDKVKSYADFKMLNFKEDRINYSMDVKEEGTCIVTLPYDKGFKVVVDGNVVESDKILDFFLGFKLSEGTHNIVITYVPSGFVLGSILTLLGIILLITLYLSDKFSIKKATFELPFNIKKSETRDNQLSQ